MATRIRAIPRLFITQMRADDIPAVMDVERECFPAPWSENAYRAELACTHARYFVAWINGQLAGYAGMWLMLDEVHVTTLGVAGSSRGQKVGERLLVRLLDETREQGLGRITLEVRKSNSVAQNLYRKYGFQDAAIRKAYYSDNNEDAVVMWIYDVWDPTWVSLFEAHKAQLETSEHN